MSEPQLQVNDLRISYSQLDLVRMCPQKYYRRYILDEPDVFGAPLHADAHDRIAAADADCAAHVTTGAVVATSTSD